MSTQEETRETIEERLMSILGSYEDLTSIAKATFPPEWTTMPMVTHTRTKTEDGRQLVTKFVATRCQSENPTREEIDSHISSIRADFGDSIKGWLIPLCLTVVPGFLGEEPTVEEFLREDFDSSRILPQAVLLSYPAIEE